MINKNISKNKSSLLYEMKLNFRAKQVAVVSGFAPLETNVIIRLTYTRNADTI